MELSKASTINININGTEKPNQNNQECIERYPWPFPFPFPFPFPTSGVPIFMKGQESGYGASSLLSREDLFKVSIQLQEITNSGITKGTSLKELNAILKPVYSKVPQLKGKLEEISEQGDENGGNGTEVVHFLIGFATGLAVMWCAWTISDYLKEN